MSDTLYRRADLDRLLDVLRPRVADHTADITHIIEELERAARNPRDLDEDLENQARSLAGPDLGAAIRVEVTLDDKLANAIQTINAPDQTPAMRVRRLIERALAESTEPSLRPNYEAGNARVAIAFSKPTVAELDRLCDQAKIDRASMIVALLYGLLPQATP